MYIKSTKRPKIIFFLSKIIPLDQKIIFIFLQKYGPKTGYKVKFFLKKLLSGIGYDMGIFCPIPTPKIPKNIEYLGMSIG